MSNLILTIETATTKGSVALHKDGQLVATTEMHQQRTHARLLAPAIRHLLALCDYKMTELSAVAVSKGPGSYTGLRIGSSTAKGLCFALDIPLLAVGTLDTLARQAASRQPDLPAFICPMIDARRMEVYCAIYNPQGQMQQAVKAQIVEENTFDDWLNQRQVVFLGDGAAKCQEVITHPNAIFIEKEYPQAACAGELAHVQWQKQAFENIAYFEPFYLKAFMGPTLKEQKANKLRKQQAAAGLNK